MKYSEMVYWNTKIESYGNAIRIKKWKIHSINAALGFIIPIIYPVPIALLINKFLIKNDWIVRY